MRHAHHFEGTGEVEEPRAAATRSGDCPPFEGPVQREDVDRRDSGTDKRSCPSHTFSSTFAATVRESIAATHAATRSKSDDAGVGQDRLVARHEPAFGDGLRDEQTIKSVEKEFHLLLSPNRSSGSGASKSRLTRIAPRIRPAFRTACFGRNATSRARGRPARAMITSSPRAARSTSCDNRILASWILTVSLMADDLV